MYKIALKIDPSESLINFSKILKKFGINFSPTMLYTSEKFKVLFKSLNSLYNKRLKDEYKILNNIRDIKKKERDSRKKEIKDGIDLDIDTIKSLFPKVLSDMEKILKKIDPEKIKETDEEEWLVNRDEFIEEVFSFLDGEDIKEKKQPSLTTINISKFQAAESDLEDIQDYIVTISAGLKKDSYYPRPPVLMESGSSGDAWKKYLSQVWDYKEESSRIKEKKDSINNLAKELLQELKSDPSKPLSKEQEEYISDFLSHRTSIRETSDSFPLTWTIDYLSQELKDFKRYCGMWNRVSYSKDRHEYEFQAAEEEDIAGIIPLNDLPEHRKSLIDEGKSLSNRIANKVGGVDIRSMDVLSRNISSIVKSLDEFSKESYEYIFAVKSYIEEFDKDRKPYTFKNSSISSVISRYSSESLDKEYSDKFESRYDPFNKSEEIIKKGIDQDKEFIKKELDKVKEFFRKAYINPTDDIVEAAAKQKLNAYDFIIEMSNSALDALKVRWSPKEVKEEEAPKSVYKDRDKYKGVNDLIVKLQENNLLPQDFSEAKIKETPATRRNTPELIKWIEDVWLKTKPREMKEKYEEVSPGEEGLSGGSGGSSGGGRKKEYNKVIVPGTAEDLKEEVLKYYKTDISAEKFLSDIIKRVCSNIRRQINSGKDVTYDEVAYGLLNILRSHIPTSIRRLTVTVPGKLIKTGFYDIVSDTEKGPSLLKRPEQKVFDVLTKPYTIWRERKRPGEITIDTYEDAKKVYDKTLRLWEILDKYTEKKEDASPPKNFDELLAMKGKKSQFFSKFPRNLLESASILSRDEDKLKIKEISPKDLIDKLEIMVKDPDSSENLSKYRSFLKSLNKGDTDKDLLEKAQTSITQYEKSKDKKIDIVVDRSKLEKDLKEFIESVKDQKIKDDLKKDLKDLQDKSDKDLLNIQDKLKRYKYRDISKKAFLLSSNPLMTYKIAMKFLGHEIKDEFRAILE